MKIRTHYIALAFFVCTIVSCSKEPIGDTSITVAENAKEIEQELLGIVNSHRVSLGQNSLEFSAVAYKYANEHTNYMVTIGTTNHDNFNIRASNISNEVEASIVSENVAKDYSDAYGALQGWLSSSDHKNTIEGEYTHTAVSVKKDTNGKLYYTQLFYK